jgi:hypothetical protein
MIFNLIMHQAAILAASIALGIVMVPGSAHAAMLTQWDFNTPLPGDSNPATGSKEPSFGLGTVDRVGGTTGTFVTADEANSASTDLAPTLDDSGLDTTTYPAATALNKSAGVRFKVSTLGQQNVKIRFDQYFSANSSKYSQFQYSANGTTFLDFGSPIVGAVNTWSNSNLFDLSNIAEVNDNQNFAFQIVAAFAPNTTGYAGTAGTYATDGTWRFDRVTVDATEIPTPAMLPGLVGLGWGLLRRRQSAVI